MFSRLRWHLHELFPELVIGSRALRLFHVLADLDSTDAAPPAQGADVIMRAVGAVALAGLAMIPLEKLHIVAPQQSLNEVLPLMVAQDVNQVPVVEDGHLVGVLSWEDIVRFLEIRRGLGLDKGGS